MLERNVLFSSVSLLSRKKDKNTYVTNFLVHCLICERAANRFPILSPFLYMTFWVHTRNFRSSVTVIRYMHISEGCRHKNNEENLIRKVIPKYVAVVFSPIQRRTWMLAKAGRTVAFTNRRRPRNATTQGGSSRILLLLAKNSKELAVVAAAKACLLLPDSTGENRKGCFLCPVP